MMTTAAQREIVTSPAPNPTRTANRPRPYVKPAKAADFTIPEIAAIFQCSYGLVNRAIQRDGLRMMPPINIKHPKRNQRASRIDLIECMVRAGIPLRLLPGLDDEDCDFAREIRDQIKEESCDGLE